MILAVGVLVYLQIKNNGQGALSDGVKKILLNWLQISSMAAAFPLKWVSCTDVGWMLGGCWVGVGCVLHVTCDRCCCSIATQLTQPHLHNSSPQRHATCTTRTTHTATRDARIVCVSIGAVLGGPTFGGPRLRIVAVYARGSILPQEHHVRLFSVVGRGVALDVLVDGVTIGLLQQRPWVARQKWGVGGQEQEQGQGQKKGGRTKRSRRKDKGTVRQHETFDKESAAQNVPAIDNVVFHHTTPQPGTPGCQTHSVFQQRQSNPVHGGGPVFVVPHYHAANVFVAVVQRSGQRVLADRRFGRTMLPRSAFDLFLFSCLATIVGVHYWVAGVEFVFHVAKPTKNQNQPPRGDVSVWFAVCGVPPRTVLLGNDHGHAQSCCGGDWGVWTIDRH